MILVAMSYRICLSEENLTVIMKCTGSLVGSQYFWLRLLFDSCRRCLAFVLVPVLGRELQDFQKLWNTHTVRYNRKTEAPHGIPNDLYSMPSESGLAGLNNYLCTLNCLIYM